MPPAVPVGESAHAFPLVSLSNPLDHDRVGLRLSGPRLGRVRSEELFSEGLVPGALQVSPDGAPVPFLADHPVTGGCPVLAVVVRADLPAVAQARPGDPLSFRPA